MTSPSWLDVADELTSSDRQRDYGHPLPNFIRIALFWSVETGIVINPIQVASMMSLTKLARDINTPKTDNHIDNVGYTRTIQLMCDKLIELGHANSEDNAQRVLRLLSIGEMWTILMECTDGN